jgi:hypothetical protein
MERPPPLRPLGTETLGNFRLKDLVERNLLSCWPSSSVGIATGYGLDGPRIESRWRRDFPHLSGPALVPIQPPVQWVPGLPWGRKRPGRDADPSPLLMPRSENRVLLSLTAFVVCRKGETYLHIYLLSFCVFRLIVYLTTLSVFRSIE